MYQAEINRTNPALILFLFDCSYSMSEQYGNTGVSKGEFLAKLCNETIDQVILSCEKGDEIRAYFEMGIIGYGDDARLLLPIQSVIDLAYHPLKMEKDTIDGIPVERPIWITDPTSRANTDMKSGFHSAKKILQEWTAGHPESFPPVLIHVSDGKWTSGKPVKKAQSIHRDVKTNDGPCIVMNIHISNESSDALVFPSSRPAGSDHQKALFLMSSELPESFFIRAEELYPGIRAGARGYMFNATPDDLTRFFDIGTRLRG